MSTLHADSRLALIPIPTRVTSLDGDFVLGAASRILVPNRELQGEATYLSGILRKGSGFSCEVAESDSDGGDQDILLRLDSKLESLGTEGYSLSAVAGNPLIISSINATGIFRGIQTLLQLLPPSIFGTGPRHKATWKLPRVSIEDSPRFAWRGAMLDCSRHFMPVEFIKKFLDLLALHKLNSFHWHLTDDQGWRLEIKRYPKLTEIGSRRRETLCGHLQAGGSGDGVPHEGYYTQEDARAIVAYAGERHITVVPEIEMPGHCHAAISAYPELGSTNERVEVETRWGIHPSIYNVKESTFEFLQNVLDEVLDIFPSKFIHVGGDEAVKTQWDANPEVQARMREVGAKDAHELQSWFIRRVSEFLSNRGRRLVGWDEIIEGGLTPGATVMSWRGVDPGIAAAKAGHDVVMAPGSHTYFDHYQSNEPLNEPLAIGGYLPLEKVYSYEPVPAELDAEAAHHILGVQGQIWTEYIPNPRHVEFRAFPRLSALAEVGWSKREVRDIEEFRSRLAGHLRRLDVLDVKYADLG